MYQIVAGGAIPPTEKVADIFCRGNAAFFKVKCNLCATHVSEEMNHLG